MEEIIFNAVYKGKRSEFKISAVSGSNGIWHLYIDNFYYGAFFIYQGDWVFRPQKDDYFTDDQIEKLVNQLRERHPVKD